MTNNYMNAIFKDVKIVQVMVGSICDKCRERMSEGVSLGRLSNGKSVFYCKGCYVECKFHGYV